MDFNGKEITIKNIRETFLQVEEMYLSAKADGERDEMECWDNMMQKLLAQMTAAQRSWCLDDFSEIPAVYKEILATIKKQEQVVTYTDGEAQ
jgi:predicted ester cyclase